MIFARPTKYRAGLTIYGDYIDLTNLHGTVHKIADEKYISAEIEEFILGLAYEIRHAYQGDRETVKMTGGTQYAPTESVYIGFNLLWTVFLPQLVMLRDAASYQVLNRGIQADLWRLEFCAEQALLESDANIGRQCLEWLENASPFHKSYQTMFVEDCSYTYIHSYRGKKRFAHLPEILRQTSSYSGEYKEFVSELEKVAVEKNCRPQDLRNAREWADFKW